GVGVGPEWLYVRQDDLQRHHHESAPHSEQTSQHAGGQPDRCEHAKPLPGLGRGYGSASITCTSSRRKDSTSVTSPTDCQLPRSASLVTTAGLMSTQTVRTCAGSILPVAIECSMVDSIRARRTPGRGGVAGGLCLPATSRGGVPPSQTSSRILRCASTISVITSGSGPSSRTLPASTISTPWSIALFITPALRWPQSS